MVEEEKKYKIFNNSIRKFSNKIKRISFPGFDKIPIYFVIKFFFSGISKGYIATRASAIAFNFALSIFPTLIFLFTLIPFIPIANLQTELLNFMQEIMPENAYTFLENTLINVLTKKNGGFLSIGALSSLIFSTNGIHALIQAFNNTYHTIETRKWLSIRAVSLILVFIISILMTTSVLLLTFGQGIITKLIELNLIETNFTYYFIIFGKWLIIIAFLFFVISALFYLAPAKKTKWRFISAGSTLATILTLLTSLGFSYFVNHFGQYNKLYGSIGTLMVILIWLYFISFAVLLGFELNASINDAKQRNLNTENHE